jgi:hypothetical protein
MALGFKLKVPGDIRDTDLYKTETLCKAFDLDIKEYEEAADPSVVIGDLRGKKIAGYPIVFLDEDDEIGLGGDEFILGIRLASWGESDSIEREVDLPALSTEIGFIADKLGLPPKERKPRFYGGITYS